MTIEEWWSSLDAPTRQWFVENPGCMVLPRTVVNAVNNATGGALPCGPHGEFGLSSQDHEFIRHQAAHHGEPGREHVPNRSPEQRRIRSGAPAAPNARG